MANIIQKNAMYYLKDYRLNMLLYVRAEFSNELYLAHYSNSGIRV